MSALPGGEPAHLVSEGLCVEKWFSCSARWGRKDLGGALSLASGHHVYPLSNPSHWHLTVGWAVGWEPGGREHNASTSAVGGSRQLQLRPSPWDPRGAQILTPTSPHPKVLAFQSDPDQAGTPMAGGWPGGAWGGLSGQVPSAAVKENLCRPPSWIWVAVASDASLQSLSRLSSPCVSQCPFLSSHKDTSPVGFRPPTPVWPHLESLQC